MDSGEEMKKTEVEDKFKFALFQVDKRLVNLELAIGEINEKIKSLATLDADAINEIKERLDELEDLIMVENLGGFELKKFMENIDSRTTDLSQKTAALSKDVKNFEALIPQVEQIKGLEEEIKKLRDKIEPLETSMIKKLEEEISDLKEKIAQPALKDDVKKLEKNIENINEKIAGILLPTEQIVDLADKILALEEKIKFLGGLKEDLTPIKTEIVRLKEKTKLLETSIPMEKVNKIEEDFLEMKEKFSQLTLKLEEITSRPEVHEAIGKRIDKLEEKVSAIPSEEKIKFMNEEVGRMRNELNDINKKISELPTKEVTKLEETFYSLTSKIDELRERIRVMEASVLKKVDEKISVLPLVSDQILSFGEEISKLKEEASNLHRRTEQIISLENEIKRLNERIRPLETQVIQRVASEVSELRTETSKEIKEIKDKISGIIATKSEIDIKFLSSRFNSLKENVDYLLNRKAEFDMKIDNLQKALAKIAEKVEEIASKQSIPASVEQRLAGLEEKIEAMPSEIFGNLKSVVSQLPSGKRPGNVVEGVKASNVDFEIKKLVEKISRLEGKLMSLEEDVKSSGITRPLILE